MSFVCIGLSYLSIFVVLFGLGFFSCWIIKCLALWFSFRRFCIE